MQILPFVFSLIMVFFFLISNMSKDDLEDRSLLDLINKRTIQRLALINKTERSVFIKKRVLPKEKKESDSIKQYIYIPRPLKAMGEYSKISLSFLQKPGEEQAKEFATNALFDVLKRMYHDKIDESLFKSILVAACFQKTGDFCRLQLEDDDKQLAFFKLLTDVKNPIGDILTLEMFDNYAFCNFHYLKRNVFAAMFLKDDAQMFFEEEKALKKTLKTKSLNKDKLTPLLLKSTFLWSGESLDRLVNFKAVNKKLLKATLDDSIGEFFYYPIDVETAK